MVDALVIVVAEGIHKKVVSIAANELALAWGYKKKLDNLEQTLKITCAKLRDTENEKGQNHGVMVWLALLNHVVGEADDLLDDVHYEMLRHEVMTRDQTGIIAAFRDFPSLKTYFLRTEMGERIKNITNKFCKMIEQGNNLGLQNRHPRLVADGFHQKSDLYLEKIKFVGRENDELQIIQLLTQSREEEILRIVPIVGMGGIGKTTLAKSVYHNPKIVQYYDLRVWLCVSVKVDVNTLLARICESLAGDEFKSKTRVNLITNLQYKLGSKRYLVILDDICDEDKTWWDDFKSCMVKVNSQNGSCFLVTTHNLEIITKAISDDFHALKGLSNEECWCIFKEIVVVEGQSLLPELEEIGRDIVNKCCGLPLLVKVIGGMLRNYNDKEKWLSIKDNKVWDQEEGNIVQNILKVSFDNLPSSIVKKCFTYCSIFKKDGVMNKKEFIQLWMAIGLVQANESTKEEMEDLGNDIFQYLVSTSLFQDVKRDDFGYLIWGGMHNFTSCHLHDLVHDLSLSISKHESTCLMLQENDANVHIPQVKHLAVYQKLKKLYELDINVSTKLKDCMTTRNLQTLFFEGEVEKSISFQCFKSVRILKFSRCKLEKLDDSIGELLYLRFLDLSYTQIRVLPRSIGKLYHLQTLMLCGCYHLLEWPLEIRNLISLRVFEFPKLNYVHMVGQLTSLRTLPFFGVLKHKGYQIEELGCLKHLCGEIHIFNLEEISSKEDALKADLYNKKNLYKVELSWSRNQSANRNDEDVLEGLQPPRNLKSLTILNFCGNNFPTWIMKMAIIINGKWTPLHRLVEINLYGCKSCLYLPILEYLPLLRDLVLESMENLTCLKSSLGQEDNITGSMKPLSPSLRYLKLSGMKRLEKWTNATTNNSTMLSPVLERLEIHNCPKIILLDECHPHPLVSLEIHNCDNLVSIKSVQGLTSLECLAIHNCPSLLAIPHFPNHGNSLKSLNITHCLKLSYLPREMFDCLAFLRKLSLGWFSDELMYFPSIQGIDKLKIHLHSLELFGLNHWESIPEEIKYLTSLTRFLVFNFGIRELPTWLTNMSSIQDMRFYDCHGLDKETIKLQAPREARNVFFNKIRL
ncbi:hypothetical protein LXL04_015082 [Taraxacum kok-saghyz]